MVQSVPLHSPICCILPTAAFFEAAQALLTWVWPGSCCVCVVYRDMLRFADEAEAEAVYSMVSLTQAGRQQAEWCSSNPADIKGPVIEVRLETAVLGSP